MIIALLAWKVTIYDLARAKFHHPAWGCQHSERDYKIAMQLAQSEHLRIDTDVLFAAAMLHDMAAFMPCAQSKMEHGDCAALQSGDILRPSGFPMQKLPATQPEAIVLHDADARMISLTGEKAESFDGAIKALRKSLRTFRRGS